MNKFEISFASYFENIHKEINSYKKLETWKNSLDPFRSEIRLSATNYWIACHEFGAVSIHLDSYKIATYPRIGVDYVEFEQFVIHNWLPLAYQVSGIQVIHASAILNTEKKKIILITGDSGSGKSTIAYGLSKINQWAQIADDRAAFSIVDGKPQLVPIPDTINLRRPSADYFEIKNYEKKINYSIDGVAEIEAVIFLEQLPKTDNNLFSNISFHQVSKTEAYTCLLEQAFALSPSLAEPNKKMITSYLNLAIQANMIRLSYSPNFANLEKIINSIDGLIQ